MVLTATKGTFTTLVLTAPLKLQRAVARQPIRLARQGYIFDAALEAATEAYLAGEITRDEYRTRVVRQPKRS